MRILRTQTQRSIFVVTTTILGWLAGSALAVDYIHFSTPVRVLIERNATSIEMSGEKGLTLNPEKSALKVPHTLFLTHALVGDVPMVCGLNRCFRSLVITSQNRFIKINNGSYLGRITASPNSTGVNIIAEVPIEDYVGSIVSAEMPPEWDMESLKAQAVAARSYVLFMKQHPRSRQYDVERTVADQVFSADPARLKRPMAAAIATAGMVLEEKGKVLKALYHARCGGMTESSSAIWKGKPKQSFRPVVCPYCQRHPYPWKVKIGWREILNVFHLGVPQEERVDFALSDVSSTGRAKSVSIRVDGAEHEISTDAFRNLLGYKRIKSALFEGVGTRNQLILSGTGAGHGVGMCQWGARFLGKTGKSYRDILLHYYPFATLARR